MASMDDLQAEVEALRLQVTGLERRLREVEEVAAAVHSPTGLSRIRAAVGRFTQVVFGKDNARLDQKGISLQVSNSELSIPSSAMTWYANMKEKTKQIVEWAYADAPGATKRRAHHTEIIADSNSNRQTFFRWVVKDTESNATIRCDMTLGAGTTDGGSTFSATWEIGDGVQPRVAVHARNHPTDSNIVAGSLRARRLHVGTDGSGNLMSGQYIDGDSTGLIRVVSNWFGIPVYVGAPFGTPADGAMALAKISGAYYLYAFLDGAWRRVQLT